MSEMMANPTPSKENATSSPTASALPRKPRLSNAGQSDASLKYHPGKWDIWMLGITIVIGGQYFSWNAGIAAGLYSYLIGCVLIGSAYVVLCCCTSEITGALPFAGGAYGLARCTLGFFPAFLIGCCEALEYIAYVSTSVLSLTNMIVTVVPALASLKPLVWAMFYISALFFHIRGDRAFWIFNKVIGTVSLVIVLIFCFGSLPFVNFATYATSDPAMTKFVDGIGGFMKVLPLACWFFVGVEALNLASDQVPQPKTTVPVAQVSCISTLLATGLAVFFVTVSLPPGLSSLPSELAPFNRGFEKMFHLSDGNATVLSLPATYATAFGFMWCYGKLIAAMATSRLLPVWLSKTTRRSGTPYMALIGGSLVSYAICIMVYVINEFSEAPVDQYVFTICISAAFMSYTGQCIGYVSLKKNYRNIKSSSFQSPFGIPGAIYAMCVWLLCLVSIIGFQGNNGHEILIFMGIVALLSIYYYAWARKRQTFSVQENRIMLVAHVMKFNGARGAHRNPKGSSKTSMDTSKHTNAESVGPRERTFKLFKSTSVSPNN